MHERRRLRAELVQKPILVHICASVCACICTLVVSAHSAYPGTGSLVLYSLVLV